MPYSYNQRKTTEYLPWLIKCLFTSPQHSFALRDAPNMHLNAHHCLI